MKLAELCEGHESIAGEHMGETVYCDGRCQRRNIAYHCPECKQVWTRDDDPQEWAYGHDCESE